MEIRNLVKESARMPQKQSSSRSPKSDGVIYADEIRLKRLGLWYLRDDPLALQAELARIDRETKLGAPTQPQTRK
jgi:hypothetical protein